jgi:Family of unknown function (DUF5329)
MTVRQRSTTPVPGSNDELRLTIDDVTRNQVMASVSTRDGAAVLAPVSLSPGRTALFTFRGRAYRLTLGALSNVLIGQDSAKFTISAGPAGATSEPEKIEALLGQVAALEGAVFIRGGAEHGPKEAADHLRLKWRAAGDRIATASQFIDLAGSKSSMTGEAYQIRFSDGRTVLAADWLRERLAEIEPVK